MTAALPNELTFIVPIGTTRIQVPRWPGTSQCQERNYPAPTGGRFEVVSGPTGEQIMEHTISELLDRLPETRTR